MTVLRITENRNVIRVSQRNNKIAFTTTQRGIPGVGVPGGGGANQSLTKASNTNYDTEWVDTPVGYVSHGGNGTAARPQGYTAIIWVGSVEPTNAIDGDIWNQVN
jgi:hypothetical protein